MATDPTDSLDRLSAAELIETARGLLADVVRLQSENESLRREWAQLKIEHQAVKDELARLKKLPPRPPIKPSGMEKATCAVEPEGGKEREGSQRRRGPGLDRLKITATVVAKTEAPAGSRLKGDEDIVVQDLSLNATATLYRRERWETPEGETIVAELDPGIVGGYRPNLHRAVLQLRFQGQMTCDRIVALLNDVGGVISKMKDRIFSSRQEGENCLTARGLDEMKGTLDPVMIAPEAALWGAIRHQGLLERAVILLRRRRPPRARPGDPRWPARPGWDSRRA